MQEALELLDSRDGEEDVDVQDVDESILDDENQSTVEQPAGSGHVIVCFFPPKNVYIFLKSLKVVTLLYLWLDF